MRNTLNGSIRALSIASLALLVIYVIASQRFALPSDPKIVNLMAWRHYGIVVSPTVLAGAGISFYALIFIGLIGLIMGVRSARWAVLFGLLLDFGASGVAGLNVTTALPRTLGGIAHILVTVVLVLCFLDYFGAASNQRLERP
jgi:hypothetical protein